jgi:hypothetical protein
MAAIVGKAMSNEAKQSNQLKAENKVELEKLEAEFSTELNNMGVRVAKLEENASSIKFGGTARIRYQQNPVLAATNKDSVKPTRSQERFSLDMKAKASENITFYGDVMTEWKSNNRAVDGANVGIATDNSPGTLLIDRAEFLWNHANTSISLGRFYTTLGQGLLWSGGIGNGLDGIYGTYNFNKDLALSAGYADMDATIGTGKSINASLLNLKYQASKNIGLTVANLRVLNHPTVTFTPQFGSSIQTKYYFDQVAFGGKAVFGDWTWSGEVVRNNADNLPTNAQRNGVVTRIQWKNADPKKPGTYSIAAEYLKLGNYATDSNWWKIALVVPGGNYIGGDGARGFGLDTHYVLGVNVDLSLKYYKLKPYDSNASSFSSYKPFYSVQTSWKF